MSKQTKAIITATTLALGAGIVTPVIAAPSVKTNQQVTDNKKISTPNSTNNYGAESLNTKILGSEVNIPEMAQLNWNGIADASSNQMISRINKLLNEANPQYNGDLEIGFSCLNYTSGGHCTGYNLWYGSYKVSPEIFVKGNNSPIATLTNVNVNGVFKGVDNTRMFISNSYTGNGFVGINSKTGQTYNYGGSGVPNIGELASQNIDVYCVYQGSILNYPGYYARHWFDAGSNGILKYNTWINGPKYIGYNGQVVTGLQKIDGKEYFFNNIQVLVKSSLNVTAWKDSCVLNMQFLNGNISASGDDNWVGLDAKNTALSMSLYNANGQTIKNFAFNGRDKGSNVASQINGTKYSNGDILIYNYNPNKEASGSMMRTNADGEVISQSAKQYGYTLNADGLTPVTGSKILGNTVYVFGSNGEITKSMPVVKPVINGVANDTLAYGTKFDPMAGVTLTDVNDPNAKIEVLGTVDTAKPGTYKLTYTVTDQYGETATATREVTVSPAVLKINGVANTSVSYGTKFDPMAGVTLTDAEDPSAKIEVSGRVDTSKPGTYKLTYTVVDQYGQKATATREVTVSPAVLKINGVANTSVSYGTKFDPMAGVTLTDAEDPSAKIEVSGTVDTSKPGTYKLTYTVVDQYGQKATATREVTVSPAVLKINGVANTSVSYATKFDPMAGVTLTDAEDPSAKIEVSGTVDTSKPGTYKLTYTVTDQYGQKATATREVTVKADYKVAINGATNESVTYKSSFNPMAGISLVDIADPTAKIEVSGKVDTSKVGTYTLTYTVTDEYGQKATVTRVINVTNDFSNYENSYWLKDGSLVMEGNISLDGAIIPSSAQRKIIIKNQDGQVVGASLAASVNWFSSNKNNYSGYQSVLNPYTLSMIKPGQKYTMWAVINNNGTSYEAPLMSPANPPKSTSKYLFGTTVSGQMTMSVNNNKIVNEGSAAYEAGIFSGGGYVLNGNINLNNQVLAKSTQRNLVVKNSKGEVIDTIPAAAVNWYSTDKNNYSGFQGVIPASIMKQITDTNSLSLSMQVVTDGITYDMPVAISNAPLAINPEYTTSVGSKGNIIIGMTKAPTSIIEKGTATLQFGSQWASYGYILNAQVNLGMNIPRGTAMQLVTKDAAGKVMSTIPVVDVNWYTGGDNYSGFQAMVMPSQLDNVKGTGNKMYVRATVDGKTYEMPLIGNTNTGTKLGFSLSTVGNQVVLNK